MTVNIKDLEQIERIDQQKFELFRQNLEAVFESVSTIWLKEI